MSSNTKGRTAPTWQQETARLARRSALGTANLLLHHRSLHRLVGRLNQRFRFLESVFVAYPASAEYASYYFSERALDRARWNPVLCAVMVQDGKVTIGMGITATEQEIRDRDNEPNLAHLLQSADAIAQSLGARHVTYSGILPGLLSRRGLTETAIEAEVTATVVAGAISRITDSLEFADSHELPVIVLGGKGFVGTALCKLLEDRSVHPVDVGDPWPRHLHGTPAVLVNVANRQALRQHLDQLWPELVLVNEVYPEPTAEELLHLHSIGVRAFHVVGVEARCMPSMPKAYRGGIPCCAAWQAETITPLIAELGERRW